MQYGPSDIFPFIQIPISKCQMFVLSVAPNNMRLKIDRQVTATKTNSNIRLQLDHFTRCPQSVKIVRTVQNNEFLIFVRLFSITRSDNYNFQWQGNNCATSFLKENLAHLVFKSSLKTSLALYVNLHSLNHVTFSKERC